MRYAYSDLGELEAGTAVTVRIRGSVSNVILVDPTNFARYRARQPFLYTGGHYNTSPVRLEVPEDGHWYVIVDTGGYRGRVSASVELEPAEPSSPGGSQRSLIEA